MQTGIIVGNKGIYGTLKYVTGYTQFSGDEAEQSGHYLAIRVDTDDENDVITMELIGGSVGHPVTLDSDRNAVIRITKPETQKLRFVITHVDESEHTHTATVTYKLDELHFAD